MRKAKHGAAPRLTGRLPPCGKSAGNWPCAAGYWRMCRKYPSSYSRRKPSDKNK